MTDLQMILLDLLKEIDEICNENNIEYVLHAGTALGAVRHQGFIPWDDDADIMMTKDNYIKFMQLSDKALPPNRTLNVMTPQNNYPFVFMRYVNTDTCAIQNFSAYRSADAGVWIDIFCLMPAPTSQLKEKKLRERFILLCEINNKFHVDYENRFKGFYRKYRLLHGLEKVLGERFFRKRLQQLVLQEDFGNGDCFNEYLYGSVLFNDGRTYSREYFENIEPVKFEDTYLMMPANKEAFCRDIYGDSWLIIPTVDDVKTHNMVFDPDYSYEIYMKDYINLYNPRKIINYFKKRKVLYSKECYLRRPVSINAHLGVGTKVRLELEQRIKKEHIDVADLFAKGQYQQLEELFKEYYDTQLSHPFKYWPVYLALDDKLLYIALMVLILSKGEYYNADKILEIRKEFVEESSTELQEVEELILISRKLSILLFDNRNYEEALKLIHLYECKYPNYVDFVVGKAYAISAVSSTKEEFSELKDEVEAALVRFPENGELMKCMADCLYALEAQGEASRWYDLAKVTTSNGIVILDIKKMERKLG